MEITEEQIKEFRNAPHASEMMFLLEQYAQKVLSKSEIKDIAKLVLNHGWSFDMVDELASTLCEAEGKLDMAKFESNAYQLVKIGVSSVKDIKDCFVRRSDINALSDKISTILGKKGLSSVDIDYIVRWKDKWDDEMILEACYITAQRGNRILKYADKILETWENTGIKTVEDVKVQENRRLEKINSKNASKPAYQMGYQSVMVYPKNPLYHKFPEEELLPCPFCGGKDIVLQNQFSQKADSYYCMVVCNVCGARTRSIKNDENITPESPEFWNSVVIDEVKALWNTRMS